MTSWGRSRSSCSDSRLLGVASQPGSAGLCYLEGPLKREGPSPPWGPMEGLLLAGHTADAAAAVRRFSYPLQSVVNRCRTTTRARSQAARSRVRCAPAGGFRSGRNRGGEEADGATRGPASRKTADDLRPSSRVAFARKAGRRVPASLSRSSSPSSSGFASICATAAPDGGGRLRGRGPAAITRVTGHEARARSQPELLLVGPRRPVRPEVSRLAEC